MYTRRAGGVPTAGAGRGPGSDTQGPPPHSQKWAAEALAWPGRLPGWGWGWGRGGAARDECCWCLHCGAQRGAKLLQPGVLSLYYIQEHPLIIINPQGDADQNPPIRAACIPARTAVIKNTDSRQMLARTQRNRKPNPTPGTAVGM